MKKDRQIEVNNSVVINTNWKNFNFIHNSLYFVLKYNSKV